MFVFVSGVTINIYSRKTNLHLVNILKNSFYTYIHLQSSITAVKAVNTCSCLKENLFLVMQLNVTKLKLVHYRG